MVISLFYLVGSVFLLTFCQCQNKFIDKNSVKKRSLEKVFGEVRTCNGESSWDPCVRRCVGMEGLFLSCLMIFFLTTNLMMTGATIVPSVSSYWR